MGPIEALILLLVVVAVAFLIVRIVAGYQRGKREGREGTGGSAL